MNVENIIYAPIKRSTVTKPTIRGVPAGMLVYNIDLDQYQVFDGSAWISLPNIETTDDIIYEPTLEEATVLVMKKIQKHADQMFTEHMKIALSA